MRVRNAVALQLTLGLTLGMAPAAFAQATASAAGSSEEVVVTGSRIARPDYVSESPIVTVPQALLQSVGAVTLDASMSQLPQIVTSAGASANAYNGGAGQAKVNLRGLGSQRTMVLIDGRRMVPALPDGSVDLNLLPSNIVQSVEVITGGASAVYGSDAVTGVVNFKLRTNFQGVEATAAYGQAEEGDAKTQDYSVLLGGKYGDDRGQSFLSVNYSDRGIADGLTRDFFGNPGAADPSSPEGNWNVVSTNLPTQAAVNTVFARYGVTTTVPRTSRFYFNTDGSLFLQSAPIVNYRGPTDRIYSTGVGFTGPGGYSQTPLQRLNIFARSSYDLTPGINVYLQGQWADYDVTGQRPPNVSGSSSSFIPTTVPVTNPFIPADLATLLASRPDATAPITIIKRSAELTPIYQQWKYQVFEVVAGASGNLPFRDWAWSADASTSKTVRDELFVDYASNVAINRLLAATDGGVSLCAGGFNPFGLHPMSQSCLDYVNRTTNSFSTIKVYSGEANLTGTLFTLPAGDAKFAAGVGYRRTDFRFRPDALVSTGELAGFLPSQGVGGSTNSKEVYGELLLPLVKDVPFFADANLDLAYRYSDHDSIGGVSTYKADVDWSPVDGLRLRGGYSRAIRAPSVGELFAPQTLSRVGVGAPGAAGSGDGCDVRSAYRAASNPNRDRVRALCLAEGMPLALVDTYQNNDTANPALSAGNASLQEETADTYSVGAVFRPNFTAEALSNISLSVDYYSISLEGSVGNITSVLAMQRCFNADGSNPSYDINNYYCQLITRSRADGTISLILNPLFNLGGYNTSGVDVGADWTLPLSAMGMSEEAGSLHFRTNLNYLKKFEIQTLAGSPFFDYAGTIGNSQIDPTATARPVWKAISSATYTRGPFDVSLNWRYLGEMDNAANVGTNGTAPPTEAVSYFDLNSTVRLKDKVEVRLGVVNLLDRDPPVVTIGATGQKSTNANTYDIIGRRYFVQLKMGF